MDALAIFSIVLAVIGTIAYFLFKDKLKELNRN